MVETDDDFEYVIHDGKGNPSFADGKGTAMTMDTFVDQTLRAKYPGAFKGSGSMGGGATKSNAGGGGNGNGKPLTIAGSDKEAFRANLDGIANGTVLVDMSR